MKKDDSAHKPQGAPQSGRSGSRQNTSGRSQGGSGGYKPREGGYRSREGGSKPREGTGGRPASGGQGQQYRPRNGSPGAQRQQGGSGGYKPREGGYKPREGAPKQTQDSPAQDKSDDFMGVPVRRSEDYTRTYRGTSARATSGQRAKGPNNNRKGKSPSKESMHKQPMLSMHKIQPFKYDMNEILNDTSLDPSKASAFLATVVAKASRISLKEAKDYISQMVEAGDITKDEQMRFNNLLQKYSKYR